MGRLIDRFDYLLFDVCGTLVFDHDRFGPEADYYATYAQLGGNFLSPAQLRQHVDQLLGTIGAAEMVEANYDPFPSLHDFALRTNHRADFPPGELERVEKVLALHELGTVSERIAAAVRTLSSIRPLGIISNLWGQAEVFEEELRRTGLLDLFWPRLWSPRVGCLKPAPRIFQTALDAVQLPPERVLYTGDTFLRDVFGAKRMGMAAAWVNPSGKPIPPEFGVEPDLVIPDVTALLEG